MQYETSLQIASNIENELYEFTTSLYTYNSFNRSEPSINNMKIEGDGNVTVKIISVFEESLALLKQHFKSNK